MFVPAKGHFDGETFGGSGKGDDTGRQLSQPLTLLVTHKRWQTLRHYWPFLESILSSHGPVPFFPNSSSTTSHTQCHGSRPSHFLLDWFLHFFFFFTLKEEKAKGRRGGEVEYSVKG